MTARVVLATRNQGKVAELRRILAPYDIELVGLEEFPDVGEVEETGSTFVANAFLKARAVAEQTGLPAIADDSGLAVEALDGAPGVRSARWAGQQGDDDANLALVLEQTAAVPDGERGAAFVCAAVVVVPGRGEGAAEGRIEGELIREPRGSNGFGYDPIFVPTGETRTTAEMPAEEKDAISHRGRAFRALAPKIADLLG